MLLYHALHWPQQADSGLWPFAMDYATWVWNKLPSMSSGYSPEELFLRTKSSHVDINRARIWGSPLYILDPKLQNGEHIPKWNKRSEVGSFMGFSPHHSSTVSLALNTTTSSVTPQFHVVHDELFTTVVNHGLEHLDELWNELCSISRENDWTPDIDEFGKDIPAPSVSIKWLDNAELIERREKERLRYRRMYGQDNISDYGEHDSEVTDISHTVLPQQSSSSNPRSLIRSPSQSSQPTSRDSLRNSTSSPTSSPSNSSPPSPSPPSNLSPSSPSLPSNSSPSPCHSPSSSSSVVPSSNHDSSNDSTTSSSLRNLRRSTRNRVKNKHAYGGKGGYSTSTGSQRNESFLQALDWSTLQDKVLSSDHATFMTSINQHADPFSGVYEELHPMLLSSKANSCDNPTYHQAVNGSDADGYLEAMDS